MPDLTFWLLRHAKTVTDPPKGGSDFDRVLAPRGRRDATALGMLLSGKGGRGGRLDVGDRPLPEVALVSPAARTVATAELVLGGLHAAPARYLVPDLYGAEPEEALDHLRTLPTDVASAMLVGHNPTAHAVAQGLIRDEDTEGRDLVVRRGFPTCALAVYRLEVTQWADVAARTATLVALFTPPYGSKSGEG
jgi:phosphohistidine phosphatase